MRPADINTDFSQHTVVKTQDLPWETSPSGTVWRKPLFRQGGEFGPVTSVVKYAAGGSFHEHQHPQGEEIYVLEGEFCDNHGRYPAGTYLLNPDGTSHAPFSDIGCTLFVRLRQYDGEDRKQVKIGTPELDWQEDIASGIKIKNLYEQDGYEERMDLVQWEAGMRYQPHVHAHGEEIFVLQGELQNGKETYPRGTWIRASSKHVTEPYYSTEGCVAYIRSGYSPT